MRPISVHAVMASAWVLAAGIAGIAANLNPRTAWAALASVAMVPSVVLLWQWSDPQRTLPARLQEARR